MADFSFDHGSNITVIFCLHTLQNYPYFRRHQILQRGDRQVKTFCYFRLAYPAKTYTAEKRNLHSLVIIANK